MSREREAKLPVEAADARRRLAAAGAEPLRERHEEENWVLDSSEGAAAAKGSLLRLRRDDQGWTLTLKGPARVEAGHKVREELETAVQDGEVLLRALEAAGLRVVWRYEKRRATYRLGPVALFLDETPIGDFLELEGEEGETEDAARRMGYDPAAFLADSYGALHRRHCEARGLPPGTDMLFPPGAGLPARAAPRRP